ncbi:hypothetical protein [Sphingomonas sp. LR55]|uniref:hypothetical protein n=1 Tax=Sphingomonas sp. LR55 TaxID=3050231 RepID=UPI002FE0DEB4
MLLLASTCRIEPAQSFRHGLVDLACGGVERDEQRFGRGDRAVRHVVARAQRFGHRIRRAAERADRRGEVLRALGPMAVEQFDPRFDFAEPGVEVVDDPVAGAAL